MVLNLFYKEWQMILGLHLTLVALHTQFTISIKQDNRIGDTFYNV